MPGSTIVQLNQSIWGWGARLSVFRGSLGDSNVQLDLRTSASIIQLLYCFSEGKELIKFYFKEYHARD
jgi:hypothetical protein